MLKDQSNVKCFIMHYIKVSMVMDAHAKGRTGQNPSLSVNVPIKDRNDYVSIITPVNAALAKK